jgi:hypothetical protein
MVDFIWDKKVQKYRYKESGKFVGGEAVQNMTRKAVAQITKDLETVGDLLIQRKINLSTWTEVTAKLLKNLHTWQYLLGAGGKKQMTQADYGSLGLKLSEQYKYLRDFAEEIKTKGMTEDEFRRRLSMYSEASTGTFEKARMRKHRDQGFQWEKRIRTKTESCQPCINYEALGWQPIGTLPNPTERCDCIANCGCYKVFEKNKPTDSFFRAFGWLNKNNN